ncbi:MAG: hypothetical protein ACD_62C00323G0004 [uncultured bacterium]|nr:MAG: hypothetical protein ACD_62C00323G0004 [uncultured bacterium]
MQENQLNGEQQRADIVRNVDSETNETGKIECHIQQQPPLGRAGFGRKIQVSGRQVYQHPPNEEQKIAGKQQHTVVSEHPIRIQIHKQCKRHQRHIHATQHDFDR